MAAPVTAAAIATDPQSTPATTSACSLAIPVRRLRRKTEESQLVAPGNPQSLTDAANGKRRRVSNKSFDPEFARFGTLAKRTSTRKEAKNSHGRVGNKKACAAIYIYIYIYMVC
jgi:hypothetical protein